MVNLDEQFDKIDGFFKNLTPAEFDIMLSDAGMTESNEVEDDGMNIIFNNGAKVINQEAMDIVTGVKAGFCKSEYEINADYNMYGDDYKIEIAGSKHQCLFILKDYDEHQQIESRIDLVLSKDEMSQLIAVLESTRDKM